MTDQPAPAPASLRDQYAAILGEHVAYRPDHPLIDHLLAAHDRVADDPHTRITRLRAAEERAGELATMLAAVLAAYPTDLNPGGPAVRPRHLPAGLVQRWRDRLAVLCAPEQRDPV